MADESFFRPPFNSKGDKMKIKGAIFDVDGTLLDSMWMWEGLHENYFNKKGFKLTKENIENIYSMSFIDGICYSIETLNLDITKEKMYEEMTDYMLEIYMTKVTVKKGVYEFLDFLKEKGVKMCVLTASERKMIEKVFDKFDLTKYFDRVLYCSEMGMHKDNPEIFIKTLEVLGTKKEETFMFEDAEYSAKNVIKTGIKLCGVFDESNKNQRYLKEISDLYLESFEDAKNFFE